MLLKACGALLPRSREDGVGYHWGKVVMPTSFLRPAVFVGVNGDRAWLGWMLFVLQWSTQWELGSTVGVWGGSVWSVSHRWSLGWLGHACAVFYIRYMIIPGLSCDYFLMSGSCCDYQGPNQWGSHIMISETIELWGFFPPHFYFSFCWCVPALNSGFETW